MQTNSSIVRDRNQPSVSGYFKTNTDACGEVSAIDRYLQSVLRKLSDAFDSCICNIADAFP